MENYLLIYEDGGYSSAPIWEDEWQDAVNSGVLEVIRFHNGEFQCRMPEESGQPKWQRV